MQELQEIAKQHRLDRLAQGLTAQKGPLEKLAENPLSLRRAIDAKCYQCEGEDEDPSVRWRIGNCELTYCALHAVRPHQKLQGTPIPKALRDSTTGVVDSD